MNKYGKIAIIPDSFKGTMTAAEVCDTLRAAFAAALPGADIVGIPAADGGEGTVDAFLYAAGGQRIFADTENALGEPIRAAYGILPDGTAVIETAAASGLPQVEGRNDPLAADTFGTGRLLLDVLDKGCRRVILGLGGSATTDLGTGALRALGVRFRDEAGRIVPRGGDLKRIARVDDSGLDSRLAGVTVTLACDVDNPLCGNRGTARVFARQKGAFDAQIEALEAGICHLAGVIKEQYGVDLAAVPGAGAAGGLGAGLSVFADVRRKSGIDAVLDACGFDGKIAGCGLVVTGEGRFDGQSLAGKVPVGVAARARRYGIPVIVIAGDVTADAKTVAACGITAAFSSNRRAVPFETARLTCRADLYETAFAVASLLSL